MEAQHDNTNQPNTVPFVVHENDMMRAERQLKRMWVAIIAALVVIVMIVASFLLYLYQYDFVSEENVTVDGADGVANYVGRDGAIYNGENSSAPGYNPTPTEW